MHQTTPGRRRGIGVAGRRGSRRSRRGRGALRPPMPPITAPVMFDTPEADRILAALQVFPPGNPWNQDVSALPVHPDSARMVAGIGADKPLRPTTSTWASSSCRPTRSACR